MSPFNSLRRRHAAGLAAALLALAAPSAHAWTDKTVRLVVPAPPGGTMDVVARLFGDALAAELKAPVIVDNKPGAGGGIGVQALLAAPTDGQTLMITASNVLTEIPHVMKSGFDPLKDVKPVATLARATMVLVGPPEGPADFKGLLAMAKASPGKLSFASYSAGTASHYAGMILNQKAGLDLAHVPFAGSPPALQQVMGGQIPMMFDGVVTSTPQIRAGKLRAYAVTSKSRSQHLPDVPSTAELGYPDLDFSNWMGVVVSGQVPADLAERINAVVTRVAAVPRLKDRLQAASFEANLPLSAAELGRAVRTEYERNAAIVKAFDIRLNQ